jgi:acyl carrier protein
MTKPMTAESLRERLDAIRSIVIDELELDPNEVTDDGHFVDDYDADSLGLIQILTRIQKELGVAVPDKDQQKLVSLNAINATVIRVGGWESDG